MQQFWKLLGTILLKDELDTIITNHVTGNIKPTRALRDQLYGKGFILSRFEVGEVNRVLNPSLPTTRNVFLHTINVRNNLIIPTIDSKNINISDLEKDLGLTILGLCCVDDTVANYFRITDEDMIRGSLVSLHLGTDQDVFTALIQLLMDTNVLGGSYSFPPNGGRQYFSGILGVLHGGWKRPASVTWSLPSTCISGYTYDQKYQHFEYQNSDVFPLVGNFMDILRGTISETDLNNVLDNIHGITGEVPNEVILKLLKAESTSFSDAISDLPLSVQNSIVESFKENVFQQ